MKKKIHYKTEIAQIKIIPPHTITTNTLINVHTQTHSIPARHMPISTISGLGSQHGIATM
jgi:hypothetical protein